jgi:hypothetical protein
MINLLYESICIGLITALIGSMVIRTLLYLKKKGDNEPLEFEMTIHKWNKNYLMEISFFFTGILIHLLLEYIGLNKWYCEKKCADDKCVEHTIVCKRSDETLIEKI